jgi:hypothetical protein
VSHVQFYKKWFSGTPVNAVKASATLGSGGNGTVNISYYIAGEPGNVLTYEVVAGSGNNISMSAVFANSKLTITLGTGAGGALDDAKNTAVLIAAAIDALAEFTATKTGTGADSLTEAVEETAFADGQYATPATCKCFLVDGSTWYIGSKPINRSTTDGWYSMTLTTL